MHTRSRFGPAFAALLVSGLPLTGAAQDLPPLPADDPLMEGWRWSHFDVDAGLPSNEVVGLTESREGRIWVATPRGVAWFDGYRWRAMDGAAGGPTAQVTSLSPRQDGGVWVTAGGLLFQGDTTGLVRAPVELGGLRARGVAEAGENLFVTSGRRGVQVRGSAGRRFERDDVPQLLAGSGPGHAWHVARDTAFQWEGEGWVPRFTVGTTDQLVAGGTEGSLVVAAFGPQGSRIWLRSPDGSVEVVGAGRSELPRAAAVSAGGDAAVGYSSGTLLVRRGGVWHRVARTPAPAVSASVLFFSSSGDLWVGSARGVSVNRASAERWTRWSQEDLPGGFQLVNEILPLTVDSVWVGTNDGVALRGEGGAVRRFEEGAGLRLSSPTALGRDRAGGVWVGSGSGFQGAVRRLHGRWERYGAAQGLPGFVHRIEADSRGDLWFLGISGEFAVDEPGVHRWVNGVLEPWEWSDSLVSERVYAFAETPDGALWFGTAAGLSRFDQGSWRHWTPGQGELREQAVYALAVDSRGRVWLGHGRSGDGLAYVDAGDRVFYPYPESGIQSQRVLDLAADGDVLWAGTSGGLARLGTGDVTLLSATEGLAAPLVWPVAPLPDRVLVGTSGQGVYELSLVEAGSPPPIVVTEPPEVREDGLSVEWRAFAYGASTSPPEVPTRYRVDGGPWSRWTTARRLGPLQLPPGRHRVEVQARGALGDQGPIRVVEVTIPGPFYRHPAILGLVALWLGSMLVGAALYARRRREGLEELRRREAKYRGLFENALVGIGLLSLEDGSVLACNDRCAEIFGFADARDFTDRFDAARFFPADIWARLLGVPTPEAPETPVETGIGREDGSSAFVRIWVRPNLDDGYVHWAVEDLTGQKEAEAERLRLVEQLHQAQKMETIGQLTGGVAHDFNNLLTVVQGNLDLLLKEAPGENELVRDLAGEALRAAERGATLTHRLLAFARKQPLRPREVDIHQTLEGMSGLVRRTIGEDVEVAFAYADELWSCRADPHQLENALLNLAINARDAMPGGGHLTLEADNVTLTRGYVADVMELEPGDYVRISVTDTGVGMSPEVVDQALHPFFTTKEVGQGSGLGLSMVYGFVKQSQGHLTLYSEPDEGTTVRLYLPRAREGAEESEVGGAPVAPLPQPRGRGQVVLLVENDPADLQLAARMVQELGYRARPVAGPVAALEALDRGEPCDLLLTDLVLPGEVDGVELARRARELRPGLPVLFMSGHPAGILARRGRLSSDAPFLEKPFSLGALARALEARLPGGGDGEG